MSDDPDVSDSNPDDPVSEPADPPSSSDSDGSVTDSDATEDSSPHEPRRPLVERIDAFVVDRPLVVLLAFLVVTIAFAPGLASVQTADAGADQFTEDVPELEAQEEIEAEFGTEFDGTGTTANLLVRGDVLSREALVRLLETQHRLETHSTLRVESTNSHANTVATMLDPSAETPRDQRRAVEEATDSELRSAISTADEEAGLAGQLSTDYNPTAQQASVAIAAVSYDLPDSASTATVSELQFKSKDVVDGVDGNEVDENVILFGDGILQGELQTLLTDTAILVFPAAILLILVFLLLAYRDPVDMMLGLSALILVMLWTFGFMGHAGIPFSDAMVTLFPLLLAVGIDFGIHIINRYREARLDGASIAPAMRRTTDQLLIAFAIVAITTIFSFAANVPSPLSSLREFGIAAAAGMLFTFLIFGLYLPAAKVLADRTRARIPYFPSFGTTPLGREGSVLGRVLGSGVTLARVGAIVILVGALVTGAAAGIYGTGVDTEFSDEAFFPEEDRLERYQALPGPLQPSEYTFLDTLRIFEEDFDVAFFDSVTIYIDEPVRDDDSLELIDRATRNPPRSFERDDDGRADAESIVTVIERHAESDEEFAAVVERNDRLGTGVPDRNVDEVYDALLDSPAAGDAGAYLADDRGSARIDFTIRADATDDEIVEDTELVAERLPMDAVPTGMFIVNAAVIDIILDSAVQGLLIAFVLTAVFLMLSYRLLEGRAAYGLINLVPVLVTVGLLVGSMRLFDVPLTPINAPILAVSIGLGVDYTVHFMHRFVDEYTAGADVFDALTVTIQGTGGALTGSMLTTVTGLGVLYLAVIPLIQEFGILLALGVFYAYATSVLILPATVVVWERVADRTDRLESLANQSV